MSFSEKYTITTTLLSFVGLLLILTIDVYLGSYIMLTGLSLFTIQVFLLELKHAKTC